MSFSRPRAVRGVRFVQCVARVLAAIWPAHDSALYRVSQAGAEQIEADGGKIERVVLDYALKGRIYSELGSDRDLPEEEFRALQLEAENEP